jgi:hypothetical protein
MNPNKLYARALRFVGLSRDRRRVYAVLSDSTQPVTAFTTLVCTSCPGHRDDLPAHSLLSLEMELVPSVQLKYFHEKRLRRIRVASKISVVSIKPRHLVKKMRAALEHFTSYHVERVSRMNNMQSAATNKQETKEAESLACDGEPVVVETARCEPKCQMCSSTECADFSPKDHIRTMFVPHLLQVGTHNKLMQQLVTLCPCRSFWEWWRGSEEMVMWQCLVSEPESISLLLAWLDWHQVVDLAKKEQLSTMTSYLTGGHGMTGVHLFLPLTHETPVFLRNFVYASPYHALFRVPPGHVTEFLSRTIGWVSADADPDNLPARGEWLRLVSTSARGIVEDNIMKNTVRLWENGKVVHPASPHAMYTGGPVSGVTALFTKLIADHCAQAWPPRLREVEAHLELIYKPVGDGSNIAVRMTSMVAAAELCTQMARRAGAPEELCVGFEVNEASQAWETLSPDQQESLSLMGVCPMLFGDGFAGTGKTHVLALAACLTLMTKGIRVLYVCQTIQGCKAFCKVLAKLVRVNKFDVDLNLLDCRTFASLEVFARHNPPGVYALGMKESKTCKRWCILDEIGRLGISQQAHFLRDSIPLSVPVSFAGGSDQPSNEGDPGRSMLFLNSRNCALRHCPERLLAWEQANALSEDGEVDLDSIVIRVCSCNVWRPDTFSTGTMSQRAGAGINPYLQVLQGTSNADRAMLTHGNPDIDPHHRYSPPYNFCTGTWDDIRRSVQGIACWIRFNCKTIFERLGVVTQTIDRQYIIMTERTQEQDIIDDMMHAVVPRFSLGCLLRPTSLAPYEHVLITNTAGQRSPTFTVSPVPIDYDELARRPAGARSEDYSNDGEDAKPPPKRYNLKPWMQGLLMFKCAAFVILGTETGYIRIMGNVRENFKCIQVGTVSVQQGSEQRYVIVVTSPNPGCPSNASQHTMTLMCSRARDAVKLYLPPNSGPLAMTPVYYEGCDVDSYVANIMRNRNRPAETALAAIANFTPRQLTKLNVQLLACANVQIPIEVPVFGSATERHGADGKPEEEELPACYWSDDENEEFIHYQLMAMDEAEAQALIYDDNEEDYDNDAHSDTDASEQDVPVRCSPVKRVHSLDPSSDGTGRKRIRREALDEKCMTAEDVIARREFTKIMMDTYNGHVSAAKLCLDEEKEMYSG